MAAQHRHVRNLAFRIDSGQCRAGLADPYFNTVKAIFISKSWFAMPYVLNAIEAWIAEKRGASALMEPSPHR